MKVNLSAGHSGVSGRFASLEEVAMEYAFLLRIDKEKR
jgi:oligopeptidase B